MRCIVAGRCRDSPTPSRETSFLSGTWSGTLTTTKRGEPDVSEAGASPCDVIPQSNRQSLIWAFSPQNRLSVAATSVVALRRLQKYHVGLVALARIYLLVVV